MGTETQKSIRHAGGWLLLLAGMLLSVPTPGSADHPSKNGNDPTCSVKGLWAESDEMHAACMWPTQLRRRADVIACRKAVVLPLRQHALLNAETDKWVYWIIVGDGDWLVDIVYSQQPTLPFYSCLYRKARDRGAINWPHDRFVLSGPGEPERWTITELGEPVKIPLEAAGNDGKSSLVKNSRKFAPLSRAGGVTGKFFIADTQAGFENFNGTMTLKYVGDVRIADGIVFGKRSYSVERTYRITNWKEFAAANPSGPCSSEPLRWISIRKAGPGSSSGSEARKQFRLSLFSVSDILSYDPASPGLCLQSVYTGE